VLARGELDRKVTVRVHACSKAAEAAVTAAGGTVERLPLPFAVRPAFKGSAHTNR
jgi:large subunit ribosomal protein L15